MLTLVTSAVTSEGGGYICACWLLESDGEIGSGVATSIFRLGGGGGGMGIAGLGANRDRFGIGGASSSRLGVPNETAVD